MRPGVFFRGSQICRHMPILMESKTRFLGFSALFANSTLTSRAAYSYSRGYSKVPKTWAEGPSVRYFGIKPSFRRASLSNVMLVISNSFSLIYYQLSTETKM